MRTFFTGGKYKTFSLGFIISPEFSALDLDGNVSAKNERVEDNPGYAHEGVISAFSVVTRSVAVGQHWTKNNLTHDPPQSGAQDKILMATRGVHLVVPGHNNIAPGGTGGGGQFVLTSVADVGPAWG